MPKRAQTPCVYPGCGKRCNGPFCEAHRKFAPRRPNVPPGGKDQFYGERSWRRFRRWFLFRHPLCEMCGGAADLVDHIEPRSQRPDLSFVESNCRPLCRACHASRHARDRQSIEQSMAPAADTKLPRTIIVAGPPGSGKTRWVQEHKQSGDLVVDLDALMSALTLDDWYDKPLAVRPYAEHVRKALIDRLVYAGDQRPPAWIIGMYPKGLEREQLRRRLGAKVIVLLTTANECVSRIRQDPRRGMLWQYWSPIIAQWWRDYYSPHEGHQEIRMP